MLITRSERAVCFFKLRKEFLPPPEERNNLAERMLWKLILYSDAKPAFSQSDFESVVFPALKPCIYHVQNQAIYQQFYAAFSPTQRTKAEVLRWENFWQTLALFCCQVDQETLQAIADELSQDNTPLFSAT